MADLNALIAQGYQFQAPPDPFVQYGKRQQLELGEQTNQLNQMKMQEAQAAMVKRNALSGLDPSSPDYENQLLKLDPTMGMAYRKDAAAVAAQKATQEAQKAQALKTSLDNHRSFLVGVNDQPSYDAWRALTTKNIPELASMLPTAFSPDAKNLLLQTADDISKRLNPPAPAQSNLARLRAEKAALPLGDPGHAAYDAAIAKETQFAPKSEKVESTIGKVDPDKFTAKSIAKYAKSNNYEDLVLVKPPGVGGEKMPTGSINVLDPKDPTGKKVIVVTAERAIKEGLVPFTSVAKDGSLTEGERKAATLLQRLQFSEGQLMTALGEDPTADKPGLLASAVAKISDPAANLITPAARQRVEAAQLDILDAALTLGTGAAYTNEQLQGYRKSYFPQIGDKPDQIKDKQARLNNVIQAAKIAAGRAEKLVPQAPQGTDGFKYLGKEGKK